MKLVTTARQLRSALAMFKRVIERRSTYPILACVLFDGKSIIGTDLDKILRVELAAAEAKGQAAIDYFTLANLMPHIPADATVTIEAVADNAVLSFEGGRYDLPCLNPDGFPDLKGWKGAADNILPIANLKRALKFVAPCISTEETRYYLNGFCISRDRDGRQGLVATDGHRLAFHPVDFDATWLDGKIVPRATAALIAHMPDQVRIETIKGHDTALRLAWPGAVLVTKLIDGNYPDWHRVTPRPEVNTAVVRFETAPLWAALRRLAAMRGKRSGSYVTIAFNDQGAVLIMRESDRGQGVERLPVAAAVEVEADRTITFNAVYALDMLRIYQASDTIDLAIKDASSPCLVDAPGHEGTAVLMPARGAYDNAAIDELRAAYPQAMEAAE